MLNKIFYIVFIFILFNIDSQAGDFCTPVPITEVIGATNTINDSTDLSKSLVITSERILSLSNSLVMAGSTANRDYVDAMLKLSQDILEMANKIGEMADRILYMADKIGDMSERILETQKIQNTNVSLTQTNILKAQQNFNTILKK